ncbi:MAG: dienelactone hydrolase [Candidatus Wallbacteria bacterium]|nr:dienelactone hydrolase [Candidatus Wallbacteria bacterium]
MKAYDPVNVAGMSNPYTIDLTVSDPERKREIPVRVYVPGSGKSHAVVLFSHGLGGSREGNSFLGQHWAQRGYVVVFLQHPGSDETVWKETRPLFRKMAMKKAASLENMLLRVKDVSAVITELEAWNAETGHRLCGRLDLTSIGMSGHSFGAATTQAVSGQRYLGRAWFEDTRIKAAVIMSPSGANRGSAEKAFGQVTVPWLLMTGTDDDSLIADTKAGERLTVFPALPAGSKYELVLDMAEHSAFADRALPGDQLERNPNHHRVILALSTAFWDAYLLRDPAARIWLDSDGPESVLEKGDRWQKK